MPIVHLGGIIEHRYYTFLSILQKHGETPHSELVRQFKDETGSHHTQDYLKELFESGLVAKTEKTSNGTAYSITPYGQEWMRAIENGTRCVVIVK